MEDLFSSGSLSLSFFLRFRSVAVPRSTLLATRDDVLHHILIMMQVSGGKLQLNITSNFLFFRGTLSLNPGELYKNLR